MLGDMHENVEALHRSIQKKTDDATKSWEALTDAITNNPGFLGTVASWKPFSTRGVSRNPSSGRPPLDVHAPQWQPEELSKNAGTQARLCGGPAFDTSLLVHAMPVQSFLNLGIAISAVPQFLESADGQDFMEKQSVLLKYNVGDYFYVPAGFLAWYTYMRTLLQTLLPNGQILFCMVGTKQSLKDAGGGVHDAVISMLQEAMIKNGSLEMYKARIQMPRGF